MFDLGDCLIWVIDLGDCL